MKKSADKPTMKMMKVTLADLPAWRSIPDSWFLFRAATRFLIPVIPAQIPAGFFDSCDSCRNFDSCWPPGIRNIPDIPAGIFFGVSYTKL
jgi:hypothetical protein